MICIWILDALFVSTDSMALSLVKWVSITDSPIAQSRHTPIEKLIPVDKLISIVLKLGLSIFQIFLHTSNTKCNFLFLYSIRIVWASTCSDCVRICVWSHWRDGRWVRDCYRWGMWRLYIRICIVIVNIVIGVYVIRFSLTEIGIRDHSILYILTRCIAYIPITRPQIRSHRTSIDRTVKIDRKLLLQIVLILVSFYGRYIWPELASEI